MKAKYQILENTFTATLRGFFFRVDLFSRIAGFEKFRVDLFLQITELEKFLLDKFS